MVSRKRLFCLPYHLHRHSFSAHSLVQKQSFAMAFLLAAALLSTSAFATVLNVQQGAGSLDYGEPIISSEALQASIDPKALLQRAETLFQIANASLDEYNHPTRVIGSEGLFTPFITKQRPTLVSSPFRRNLSHTSIPRALKISRSYETKILTMAIRPPRNTRLHLL
jgi:hypothetical protein